MEFVSEEEKEAKRFEQSYKTIVAFMAILSTLLYILYIVSSIFVLGYANNAEAGIGNMYDFMSMFTFVWSAAFLLLPFAVVNLIASKKSADLSLVNNPRRTLNSFRAFFLTNIYAAIVPILSVSMLQLGAIGARITGITAIVGAVILIIINLLPLKAGEIPDFSGNIYRIAFKFIGIFDFLAPLIFIFVLSNS